MTIVYGRHALPETANPAAARPPTPPGHPERRSRAGSPRLQLTLGHSSASRALAGSGQRQMPLEHLDARQRQASAATASAPVGLGRVGR